MDRKEEAQLIQNQWNLYRSYSDGDKASNEYTDEEIEEKRQYYLSLKPTPESGISVKRWLAEVDRQILKKRGFRECPDLTFAFLDSFRVRGF